jgi:putative heme transporter
MSSGEPNRLRIEIAPKTILLIFGLVAAVWLLGKLTAVLTVVVVALVMVGTFDPLVSWFERRGVRRGRALVLVLVTAALAFTGVLLLMVPPLVAQVLALIENAPKVKAGIIEALAGERWAKPIVQAVNAVPLDNLVSRAGESALAYSANILTILGYALSTLFLAIYLLADPVRSKGFLYACTPRQYHVKLAKILLELKVIVGGYMRGQLITSLSIAGFVFVLLTLFGAENALAIALFAGMTDIIPFVGGYVASAPVIIAVVPMGTSAVIIVTLIMFIYQEFESRILVPRVYGKVLRLPPAVVLIALLVGGSLAGIVGALLSLPIAAGIQMLVRELRVDLPGEAAPSTAAIERDERATEIYQQITEGIPAADAGVVADDLARMITRSEHASEKAEQGEDPTPEEILESTDPPAAGPAALAAAAAATRAR